jgi:hypothetical protein
VNADSPGPTTKLPNIELNATQRLRLDIALAAIGNGWNLTAVENAVRRLPGLILESPPSPPPDTPRTT